MASCSFPFTSIFSKPAEYPHPMINMGNIIARLQVINLFESDGFLTREIYHEYGIYDTLENLVVGIAKNLQMMIDKSLMQAKWEAFHVLNIHPLFFSSAQFQK
jgi:hypothetical protein